MTDAALIIIAALAVIGLYVALWWLPLRIVRGAPPKREPNWDIEP